MTSAEATLVNLRPELLKIFSNNPEYGSVGINITLHNNNIVRVDSSRTVIKKVAKEEK